MSEPVTCYIYRSGKKQEMYLFLGKKDDFSDVPEPLLKQFGRAEFAMELELTPERQLARSDAGEVMAALKKQGFYLQMPPADLLTQPAAESRK